MRAELFSLICVNVSQFFPAQVLMIAVGVQRVSVMPHPSSSPAVKSSFGPTAIDVVQQAWGYWIDAWQRQFLFLDVTWRNAASDIRRTGQCFGNRREDMARVAVTEVRQHEKYKRLIAAARKLPALATAVAHPCDETSLRGAIEAAEAGMIRPILVGPKDKISRLASTLGLRIEGLEVIDVPHSDAAAEKAVELVRSGKAELLMKGSLHSDELLSAVTKRDTGLRTGRRISHVFVMDVPTHPQTLFITDAAVNIAPDLMAKRDIIQNAINLYAGLGLGTPKVAILSAVETVTPSIPSTIDAAALCKMADRGQITGGELDGPLAFDNAISPEAARIKGIKSPVAGQAQILVVPDLEAGNMLAKNLTFISKADAAGIVLGARVPIILTSRADNVRTRMASCAVAMLLAHSRLAKEPIRT